MGDFPVESLGGLTPLQAAKAPTLQKIASSGDLRMVNTVPKIYLLEVMSLIWLYLDMMPNIVTQEELQLKQQVQTLK